jgi:aminopeptidase N
MSSWTRQSGYPLLTVRDERLPGDQRLLYLEQQRYLADGSNIVVDGEDEGPLWEVPVGVAVPGVPNTTTAIAYKFVLGRTRNDTFALQKVNPDEWIKVSNKK